MAKKPKIILGFAILFLISLAFIALSLQNIRNKVSTAELSVGVNSFKINFNILPEDRNRFEKSLEKLTFPRSIEKGISFELDSTSAAQLAFVTPVTVEINFSKDSLRINGQLYRPYTLSTLNSHQLKLPNSTNVAIAGASLAQFAKSKLELPQSLLDWIEASFTPDTHQYIFNFQENINAFAFQSNNPIDDLKNLESADLKLKEEAVDDTKIIYLTFPDSRNQEEKTISIAKVNDLVFVTPTQEIIKDLINFQKSPKDEIDFPKDSKEQISYAIYAKNNSDQFTQILRNTVFFSKLQTLEFAKNIESFYLALSKKSFSGLIVIK